MENQPAGTLVGEFTAIDPDGLPLTYTLTNKSNANLREFVLSSRGKLSTTVPLDLKPILTDFAWSLR